MKEQTFHGPSCGGANFYLGAAYEVAWVKASFHVDSGETTARVTVEGQVIAETAISGGQDVVLEGRREPPVTTEFILIGLYPVAASISNITLEWTDEAQAPADVFAWLKKHWYIPTGGGIVGLALLLRKVRK